MSTSGTVNTTSIKTSNLLEKAMRRCGLTPQQITPEIVESAQESLFMLLLSLSNRGLNLWCVDRQLMPLYNGQATYPLPTGTQVVLNLLHVTPTFVTGTDTQNTNDYQTQLTAASKVVRFGVKFATSPTAFTFEHSTDGVTWSVAETISGSDVPTSNVLGWFNIDPAKSDVYFRINSATAITVTSFQLCSEVREINIAKFNRDDFANQPNKMLSSETVTNYYFEKLVEPQITVWPVPASDNKHLSLFRYRQIQDVGTLTQELELPKRWLEAISWHLALRLAFEVPSVDPNRRAEVRAMAAEMVIETERGESDDAPVRMAPAISCYTA